MWCGSITHMCIRFNNPSTPGDVSHETPGGHIEERSQMLKRRSLLLSPLLGLTGRSSLAAPDMWAALRAGDAFVLLRHAIAPGVGDPPGMRIGDCSTQRNLSAEGRAQALRIGLLFQTNGVAAAEVHSSQWCRCLDTANLLGLGPVLHQPLLNSFFGTPADGKGQTASLKTWLSSRPPGPPLVLVTHQVNITALTALVPSSGELIFAAFAASGDLTVLGRQSAGA